MGDGEGQSSVVPLKEERINQRQIGEEEVRLGSAFRKRGAEEAEFSPLFLGRISQWGRIGSGITRRGTYLGAGDLELFGFEMHVRATKWKCSMSSWRHMCRTRGRELETSIGELLAYRW